MGMSIELLARESETKFHTGKRVSVTNSLKSLFPEIARQWHPTANGSLTPANFTYGSETRVWWKCKEGPDHQWQSPIYSRTGKGRYHCPFCIGKRVSVTNSLKSLFPEIARQWHPTANGALTPADFAHGSEAKVWWKCKKGPDHEWLSPIYSRTGKGRSHCPFCTYARSTKPNNLKSFYPYVAKDAKDANDRHQKKKRSLKLKKVMLNSVLQVWMVCPEAADHEWQAKPFNRTARGIACPFCAGKRNSTTNSLAALFPHIAHEWHETRNKNLRPSDVTSKSGKIVWWQCINGHCCKQAIGKRTARTGNCPQCKLPSRIAMINSVLKEIPKFPKAGKYPATIATNS